MDVLEAVLARQSIRAYKPDPVPEEVIVKVLSAALYAPSPVNCQPWEITVLTGAPLEALKRANVAKFQQILEEAKGGRLASATYRARSQDVSFGPLTGEYRSRQVDLGKKLYTAMGIAREDNLARAEWQKRGYRFFDAPVGIIISSDESVNANTMLYSAGALSQTISLLALKYGLGTCILEQVVSWSDEVRKITGIPASRRLVIGMAMGYPDWAFPANGVRPGRRQFGEVVSSYGAPTKDATEGSDAGRL